VRVLHVLPSLDQRSGGPIRAVLDLSDVAQGHGFESEVVGVGDLNILDNPLQESLIHSCPSGWPTSYSYSSQLRSWLKKNVRRFDGIVLHGMWLYPNWVGAQECVRAGVPYVCVPHGMLEPWAVGGQGWWKYFKKHVYWHLTEKHLFDKAAGVFFATKREYELAKIVFPLLRPCVIIPPFGVDKTAEMVAESPSVGVSKVTTSRYVLFLGRIHPKKNLAFLFRAWAQANVKEGWRLIVAGSAEKGYLAELKRLAAFLKIDRHVTFLEFISGDDKTHLLRNAKWLLLPSKQESFGIVVLEALQNGCPVAISDQVFLADELKSSAAILKLQMDDWVRFFCGKMADEQYRLNCVERGRKVLFCNYNIQTIAELWATALTALFCQGRVS